MGRKSIATKKKNKPVQGARSVEDSFPPKSTNTDKTESTDPSTSNNIHKESATLESESAHTLEVDEPSTTETTEKETSKAESLVHRRVSARLKRPVAEDVLPAEDEPFTKQRKTSSLGKKDEEPPKAFKTETAEKETSQAEPLIHRRVSARLKRPAAADVLPAKDQPCTKQRKMSSSGKKDEEPFNTDTERRIHCRVSTKRPGKKDASCNRRQRSKDYEPLLTRMSPSLIINFINSNPSEKQIEAIRSMGFGELLKLRIEEIPSHLARWIVESFNPFDCSLMNGKLAITDEDVYLATGIPMGPLDINQVGRYCKEEAYSDAVRRYKEQFTTSNITKKVLLEKMMEQRDGGDDFKRNFLVYIVSVLLMGVASDYPSTRILSCLTDLSKVATFNWCKFARVHMMNNVISWKNAAAKDPGAYFKGPILIFCLIYLDRVVFKTRTVDRSFPLLANWSDKLIRERVKMEKHDAKGFGHGRVESRYAYKAPISEPDQLVDDLGMATRKEKVECNEDEGPCDERKQCIWILADTAVNLAHSYDAFSKAIIRTKSKVSGIPAVTKLSTLADLLFEGFSLSQQSKEDTELDEFAAEMEEFADNRGKVQEEKLEKENEKDDHEMQEGRKDEGKVQEGRKDEGKVQEAKKDEANMHSDEFYNNPAVLADLEGILNSAYNRVGEAFKEHQVEKLKLDKILMEGASFSVFPETSQEFLDSTKCANVSTSAGPSIPSPPRAIGSDTLPMASPPHPNTSSPPAIPSPSSPIAILSQLSQLSLDESPIILPSPVVQLSPTVPPLNRKCKRKVELPVARDMPYSDEHLMNFIRTNVANKEDIVVDTKWLQVTQGALSTLFRGNWVMDMVIDIVGIRLTLERPDLVYFPTIIKDVVPRNSFRSQYIKLQYLPKSLTKAQLVFFPFCVDRVHWFACVSDFHKKTNCILDSSLPRRVDGRLKFLVQTLFPALEIIASNLRGYKRLLQIKNFEWEIVDVPRQTNGYSCGIYLLKWLENLRCQSLWPDKTCYENLDEYG